MRKAPDTIASIEDLRKRAHARVPKPFMDYMEAGSFAQITLRENRRDLDAIRFRERVMFDVSNRKLDTTMLGEKVAIPVAIGPTGMLTFSPSIVVSSLRFETSNITRSRKRIASRSRRFSRSVSWANEPASI